MMLFVYGSLRDEDIFKRVTSKTLKDCGCQEGFALPNFRAYFIEGECYPGLKKEIGHRQAGSFLRLSPSLKEVLLKYEDPEDYDLKQVIVERGDETLKAFVFFNREHLKLSNKIWSFDEFCLSEARSQLIERIDEWLQ